MNKGRTLAFLAVATAFGLAGGVLASKLAADDDQRSRHFRFAEDSLVLSKSVYAGSASTVIVGEALPPGCMGGASGLTVQVPVIAGGALGVPVPCGFASDNGEFPNDQDSHNVWNNSSTDNSFGITNAKRKVITKRDRLDLDEPKYVKGMFDELVSV